MHKQQKHSAIVKYANTLLSKCTNSMLTLISKIRNDKNKKVCHLVLQNGIWTYKQSKTCCCCFHTRTKCYSLAQVSKMLMHPFIPSPPFTPSFTLKPENDPLFPATSSNESKLVKWHTDLLVKSPHSVNHCLAVAL